jgi:hypothetical protein
MAGMNRIVHRRYGDGVPSNGIFFVAYGGCRACSEGDPGCTRLVWNPIGTLLDREKWPDHWNTNVWRGLVERWAAYAFALGTLDGAPARKYIHGEDPYHPDFRLSGGELALWAWQNTWPLPLGQGALAQFIDDGIFPRESKPSQLFNFLPFGGDELGALILSGYVGDSLVEFFGLAEPVLDEVGNIERYKPGEALFRITGFDLAESDVHRFTVNARRWWATFADREFPVQTGRTPGSTIRDRNYYLSHFRDLCRRLRRPATQREFITYLQNTGDEHLNRTTLKRNLGGFNLWPWDRFVAATRRADNRR